MGITIGRALSCYLTIIAALACSIFVFAKPPDRDKEKENNSEVKFTARTELVLIPTLVTDKSGTYISGLKKEDFRVLENGAEPSRLRLGSGIPPAPSPCST
jgi:hypothetical protein